MGITKTRISIDSPTLVNLLTMRFGHQAGFTLIELLIVVAIISILGAIAMPAYYQYMVKTKRSEAYMGLKSVFDAELAFGGTTGYYSTSMSDIGISFQGLPNNNNHQCSEGIFYACGRYYTFRVLMAAKSAFCVEAEGSPDAQAGSDSILAVFP